MLVRLWQLLDRALDGAQAEGPDAPNVPEYLVVETTLRAFIVGNPRTGRVVLIRWSKLSGTFDVVRAERTSTTKSSCRRNCS